MRPQIRSTSALWAAALVVLVPSAWAQGPSASFPDSDAALDALLPAPAAVVTARIGDRLGAGQHELKLAGAAAQAGASTNFGWVNGASVPFRLTHDGFGQLTFTVGGKLLGLASSGPFEGLALRAQALPTGSSLAVRSLMLNADALPGELLAESLPGSDPLDFMLLHGTPLQSGFVLRGELTLSWVGAAPKGDQLGLVLRAGALAQLDRNYCAATVNSIGERCRMSVGGTSSISAADLELRAQGGIPGSAALFLVGGSGQATPFGNGWLCAGPPLERFDPVLAFDALGTVRLPVDYPSSPLGSGVLAVAPGTKRYLQLWYRDAAAAPSFYNLSDAVELTFVP